MEWCTRVERDVGTERCFVTSFGVKTTGSKRGCAITGPWNAIFNVRRKDAFVLRLQAGRVVMCGSNPGCASRLISGINFSFSELVFLSEMFTLTVWRTSGLV